MVHDTAKSGSAIGDSLTAVGKVARRDFGKLLGLGAAAILGSSNQASAQGAGCTAAESTYDVVRKKGVMTAGVRYDYAPVGSLNKQGKPEGFGIDIAEEFGKRLGVKVEYTASTAATRIPLLTGGHMDVGIEIPTISVQRQQVIDFSFPYLWDGNTILVKKDSPIMDVRQLQPPHKLAITRGNTQVAIVKAAVPGIIIVEYPDYATSVVALTQGIVDAAMITTNAGKIRVKQNPSLKLGNEFDPDVYGLTLRQNDSRWRNWLEFTLQKMWQEGRFQELYRKWYEVDPDFTLWSGGPARLQPGIEKWDGKV